MLKYLVSILMIATPASAETADIIREVQVEVNSRLRFLPEQPGKDVWKLPKRGYGDCEDFALLKRQRLIEAGWEPDDLAVVLVSRRAKQGGLEGHAVLWVKSVDLVLDSPLESSSRMKLALEPDSFDNWSKIGGWNFVCEFGDLSLGQIDGPVTKRCRR